MLILCYTNNAYCAVCPLYLCGGCALPANNGSVAAYCPCVGCACCGVVYSIRIHAAAARGGVAANV